MQRTGSRVEERSVIVFNQPSRVVHLSHPEICPNDPSHPSHGFPIIVTLSFKRGIFAALNGLLQETSDTVISLPAVGLDRVIGGL